MAVALASRSARGRREAFLERRARVFKASQERVLQARTPVLARALAGAFRQLRDSAFAETKDLKGNLPVYYSQPNYDEFEDALTKILTKEYVNVGNMSLAGVRTHLDIVLEFDLNERIIPKGVIARHVTGISGTAQRTINNIVRQGIDDGVHPSVIGKRMRDTMTEWADLTKSRAYTIARTETATAYNLGAILGYRQSKLVRYVRVLDGSGCGWLSHNDPDLANGKIVTLDEAQAHPIAHPNCLRAFAPVAAGLEPDELKPKAGDPYADPKSFGGAYYGAGTAPLEEWAATILDGLPADLVTSEMQASLSFYSGSGYKWMNQWFRDKDEYLRTIGFVGLDTETAQERIRRLESYIGLASTPDSVVVHRGVGSGRKYRAQATTLPNGDTDWNSIIGQTFDEPGFMSTALDKRASFGGVKLELTVPKGYPALPVSNRAVGSTLVTDYANAMTEAELLLQHGASYVIDSVEVTPRGVTLKGRVLP